MSTKTAKRSKAKPKLARPLTPWQFFQFMQKARMEFIFDPQYDRRFDQAVNAYRNCIEREKVYAGRACISFGRETAEPQEVRAAAAGQGMLPKPLESFRIAIWTHDKHEGFPSGSGGDTVFEESFITGPGGIERAIEMVQRACDGLTRIHYTNSEGGAA